MKVLKNLLICLPSFKTTSQLTFSLPKTPSTHFSHKNISKPFFSKISHAIEPIFHYQHFCRVAFNLSSLSPFNFLTAFHSTFFHFSIQWFIHYKNRKRPSEWNCLAFTVRFCWVLLPTLIWTVFNRVLGCFWGGLRCFCGNGERVGCFKSEGVGGFEMSSSRKVFDIVFLSRTLSCFLDGV